MNNSYEKNKKIFVCGGDLRQIKCAEALSKKGYEVILFGAGKRGGPKSTENPEKDIYESKIIVLPLPVTYDNINLNAPLCDNSLPLELIYENINPNAVVFGGMVGDSVKNKLSGNEIYDYAEDGEFLVKNAMITAEGAFQLIFSETPVSVCGSEFLIAGYGRIGKTVAKAAATFGARVSVAARKTGDLAWIELNGYSPYEYKELYNNIGKFDIIVNTVPHRIFDKGLISKMDKNALYIDLASVPGGCDMNDMQSMGIKAIHALSLPGKIAPFSSGKIIADTIINMLDKD